MATKLEVRLGQLLIGRRWSSLSQINAALSEQARLREQGESVSLETLLLRNEIIDEQRLFLALSELGILRFTCPECQRETEIPKYRADADYLCSRCDVPLAYDDGCSGTRRESGGSLRLRQKIDEELAAVAPEPASSEPVDDPIIHKMVGGCQVLRRIAGGGMGVVYEARQLKLGRKVAIKVLSEELAKDRTFVHRFLQEARAAGELNHGNIVQIIDVGELSGLFYIIMEYVDGQNLRQLLEECSRLDPVRALEIGIQASQALRHAHRRGVIHRDIKPENIMLDGESQVKIADLGLAKKITSGEQDGGITNSGAILGTPFYMAPEQVKDFSKVDGRSDIYSLGVTLFRALSGVVPFQGRTPVEVMIQVVDGKRPALRSIQPDIPPEVELLVDRMMHRQPESRFQDLDEVIQEMEQILYRLRAGAPAGSGSPDARPVSQGG